MPPPDAKKRRAAWHGAPIDQLPSPLFFFHRHHSLFYVSFAVSHLPCRPARRLAPPFCSERKGRRESKRRPTREEEKRKEKRERARGMEEKGWKKKRRNLKTFSSFGGDAAAFVASFSLSNHGTSFDDCKHTRLARTASTSPAAALAEHGSPLPWRREENLQHIKISI